MSVVPRPPFSRRASTARWDAIVVGSGIGGCVAAAYLARAGERVRVLERNERLGGALSSHSRDGFKFDLGSHLVARGDRGPIGQILRELSLDSPRLLRHPIPVRSRGMFDLTAPEHRSGLLHTAFEAAAGLGLDRRQRLHAAHVLVDALTFTPPELARWNDRSLEDFLRRYTDDPRVYFLVSFLASIFFVLPPWQVAAGEAIQALRTVVRDYALSYVEGGMDALPHALLNFAVARGAEVAVDAEVLRLERGVGGWWVHTREDTVFAPKVILGIAPVHAVELLPRAEVPAAWRDRIRALAPSGNAHQLRVALSRPLVDEGCLIGGISLSRRPLSTLSFELMHDTVERLARGEIADPLPVYAPVPSNYDPSLAPPGCQLLIASIYGPSTEAPVDPPEAWHRAGLKALASVIPGFDDALLFSELASVPTLGRWMGRTSNAAVAVGQAPGQVGTHALGVRTPLAGVSLCGDGVGAGGIGLERAALSGRAAALAAVQRPPTRPSWASWSLQG